jgi:hypothetical protein
MSDVCDIIPMTFNEFKEKGASIDCPCETAGCDAKYQLAWDEGFPARFVPVSFENRAPCGMSKMHAKALLSLNTRLNRGDSINISEQCLSCEHTEHHRLELDREICYIERPLVGSMRFAHITIVSKTDRTPRAVIELLDEFPGTLEKHRNHTVDWFQIDANSVSCMDQGDHLIRKKSEFLCEQCKVEKALIKRKRNIALLAVIERKGNPKMKLSFDEGEKWTLNRTLLESDEYKAKLGEYELANPSSFIAVERHREFAVNKERFDMLSDLEQTRWVDCSVHSMSQVDIHTWFSRATLRNKVKSAKIAPFRKKKFK